jgi:hypothetical protein
LNHLTPDELIDALDGTVAASAAAHLSACDRCQRELSQLTAAWLEVRQVPTPEPSPLFWDHLSARVRTAVDHDQSPAREWTRSWLRWSVWAPVTALVFIAFLLGVVISRAPNTVGVEQPATAAAEQPVDDLANVGEREWAVVSAILVLEDLEVAQNAGLLVRPGDVEWAAQQLSESEQETLIKLIKAETERAGG